MVNPRYNYWKKRNYRSGAKTRVRRITSELSWLNRSNIKTKPRVLSCEKVSLSPDTINRLKYSHKSQNDIQKDSQGKTPTETFVNNSIIDASCISDPIGLFFYTLEFILLNELYQNNSF